MATDPPNAGSAGDNIGNPSGRNWAFVVGIVALFLAALFFMGIVVAGMLGHTVPCDTKVYAHMVLAILVSAGSGFLGGWAKAEGKLTSVAKLIGLHSSAPASTTPEDGSTGNPVGFGVGGGIAVFVIVFLLASLADRCPGDAKYKLQIEKVRTSTPPPPSEKDWLITVDFTVDPIPPSNYSLILEFSVKPDFQTLIGPPMRINSPAAGQSIDQIQAPPEKQAWARLLIRDTADRQVAVSKIVQVKEEPSK